MAYREACGIFTAEKELSKCKDIDDDQKERISNQCRLVVSVSPYLDIACRETANKALDVTSWDDHREQNPRENSTKIMYYLSSPDFLRYIAT